MDFTEEYRKRFFLPHLIAFRRYILAVLNKNVVVVRRSLKVHSFAMILHSQFNLAFQFRRLSNLKIKLIDREMFELHERMPGMRSAEYQATIPLTFFIIIHNFANI